MRPHCLQMEVKDSDTICAAIHHRLLSLPAIVDFVDGSSQPNFSWCKNKTILNLLILDS